MDHFYALEDKDGVRFSWNIWPSSRIEYKKIVAPISCMYTPLKSGSNITQVYYNAVHCSKCSAYLNPYCKVDLVSNYWTCPFCAGRNNFPSNYAGMTENNLPAELLTDCTTIEYKLPGSAGVAPVFLFVVDTVIKHDDERQAMKNTLLSCISAIPQNAFVGLVTFGAHVNVFELACAHFPKSYAFDGEKDYEPEAIHRMLSLGGPTTTGQTGASAIVQTKNRFILPITSAQEILTNIINEIDKDPFYNMNDTVNRPARATGTALSVALSLMQHTFPNSSGRVMLVTAGPPSSGPGRIVGLKTNEEIRSHHHLRNEKAKFVSSATNFYTKLAKRACTQGHAVDIFSCSLDQTGILEMYPLLTNTGGVVVSTESFQHPICRESMLKLFEKDETGNIKTRFNASVELVMSQELKVCGAIGHLHSEGKKTTHVDNELTIGIGGTSAWKTCVLDNNNTYAFYFDVVNPHNRNIQEGQYGVIQFRTTYQHPEGYRLMRVTTVAHTWSGPATGPSALIPGFDQEACTALMARLAVFKALTEEIPPLKWIDRHLIQIVNAFAKFQKDVPESFELPAEFRIYPEFMFNLRRGSLIQEFGNSPDETTYYRYYLLRENVSNCLTMIQPSLDAYAFDSEEPMPVLLTVDSVKPDQILLLDTFFHVIVHSGDTIASWRKAGYHEKEDHENFRQLLLAPKEDAMNLMRGRFPYPMFIECDQRTSQARFLLAVLDPGAGGNRSPTSLLGAGSGDTTAQEVYSEDVPLQTFIDHLKKKAVSYEP